MANAGSLTNNASTVEYSSVAVAVEEAAATQVTIFKGPEVQYACAMSQSNMMLEVQYVADLKSLREEIHKFESHYIDNLIDNR
ncbi:hypothetical protein Leryth_015150 [Lithospermum erythrorhizon]|nr:hypothetical protein Leryth_015150 [Lithospermum erythrorhizon]